MVLPRFILHLLFFYCVATATGVIKKSSSSFCFYQVTAFSFTTGVVVPSLRLSSRSRTSCTRHYHRHVDDDDGRRRRRRRPTTTSFLSSFPSSPSPVAVSSLRSSSSTSSSSSSQKTIIRWQLHANLQEEEDEASSSSTNAMEDIVPGIGLKGCQLPSPSGINTLSDATQQAVFVGTFVALGVCVLLTTFLFNLLSTTTALVPESVLEFSARYVQPIVLGLVFVVAGITHFSVADEYMNIMPPKGTWGGLWQLPGSSKFHVSWTGIAEFLGGIGLLVGVAFDILQPVYVERPNFLTNAGLEADAAALLFLLTVAVTPANIYMYTHGARLPMEAPPVPIEFHYTRFLLQVILLTLLWQIGGASFDAILLLEST